MFDYDVLSLLSNKHDFDMYHRYIKEHVLQPETAKVIRSIGDYYKEGTADSLEWGEFSTFFWTQNAGVVTPANAPVYRSIISKMAAGYVRTKSSDELLKHLIECDYASKIAETANDIVAGTAKLEGIDALIKKALHDVGRISDTSTVFVKPGVRSVLTTYTSSGYSWRLRSMRESLGPLRKGDFIVVAARVEVGKTTFLLSEVTNIAQQMHLAGETRPIIWVNNEEQSEKVEFRAHQAALAKSTADITSDPDATEEAYESYIGPNRIRITDGNVNTVSSLESLFTELNPCMIVFDQLDKVGGFYKSEREDQRLGKLYKWARELARTYGPVITASQLSAEVDGADPRKAGFESLRGSKVDKPGEADVIITLSKDPSLAENSRILRVTKNKMMGPLVEAKRHATHEVFIDEVHARYYD